MTNTVDFKRIAVIGAGTMGSGIAGQIANAGHKVLLLDLPKDGNRNAVTEAAVERLMKSDPPALMHKSRADLIELGNTEDDFGKLSECDWIVEAVVERLDIKKALYKRLDEVISNDCVVTSNTSTIPIKVLVEDMPESFRKRFAITHYFNPVRYMRLLELVRGADTDADVMARLSRYNDEVMGKGVVSCNDTPGFLGNRVGVYALQVGLSEAAKLDLPIEDADALMGRPMGIPKTGCFGLYDLIGVDLMADVVDTLASILPADDPFHAVGRSNNPVMPLIADMVADGFTGDKGKGGFYRVDESGAEQALALADGAVRARIKELPPKAIAAAEAQALGNEPLTGLIAPEGDEKHAQFARRVLGRVLGYAASLVPEITQSPQDIDDAMKLGFNWVRGPFEMIDALGAEAAASLIQELGNAVPRTIEVSANEGPFYRPNGSVLEVLNFDEAAAVYKPVQLPKDTQRFSMMRQTMEPIARNQSASLYALPDDLRLIEFHSKANALTGKSMEIVAKAATNHGKGILVHNDAQHFSAGVDLNHFRALIESNDWNGIDAFLHDFQMAVKALKYAPVPVVGAPSGLGLGGGFEVLLHCDQLVVHANSVLGLVEAAVGVVPSGGGVKEAFWRWYQATENWEEAAWQTWMQVGYAHTGSSPELATKFQYFQPDHDEVVMNRDKLITQASATLKRLGENYKVPAEPHFELPGKALIEKMDAFMSNGVSKGWFMPHDKTTAMEIATIVVNDQGDNSLKQTEDEMYARERAAFIRLAKTPQTQARIASMLDDGAVIRN